MGRFSHSDATLACARRAGDNGAHAGLVRLARVRPPHYDSFFLLSRFSFRML